MADAAKYQKLASEYAKLKAQIPVLKKAYLDEQGTSNDYKDQIKERDQALRKYEQEVDSLSFRNQQLSKRVLFLQEELDTVEATKKKKNRNAEPSTAAPMPESPGVYSEELFSKIQENERLHKQVDDSYRQYQARIQELETRLEFYEKECNQHQQVLQSTLQKSKDQIDKLQQEKAMVEVKLQKLESDVKSYRSRAELSEEKLDGVQSRLQGDLQQARKIIADKLPFIDTKHRDLNCLNLPTHDRKHQLRARELVNQSVNHLSELVQALSNFYTYSEQRSKIYPIDGLSEPLSSINLLYCKYLHENVSYLRPCEQALRSFLGTFNEDSLTTLETATDLLVFSKNFRCLVAYMNKLLPYQLASIEEECAVSSCTSTLENKNMDLHRSLKHLTSVFNKLDTYIALLATQSQNHCHYPHQNHFSFFVCLSKVLQDLDTSVRDVSKHYNSKVSLEHQLPTATQKLKTTDECIVSSLISMVTCTGKVSAFFAGNLDFFKENPGYRTRGSSIGTDTSMEGPRSSPATVCFRQKAATYLSHLSAPCPETVPHRVAVQNRKVLLSSTESREGLSKQLTTAQTRVNKLEQEKEHWMLELQLLQIKHDKETEKVQKLEKDLAGRLASGAHRDSIEDNITKEPSSRTWSLDAVVPLNPEAKAAMFGKLDMASTSSSDAETREVLIKNHFTNRINEQALQLQLVESKAVNFHSEVRALHKQLQIAEKSKTRCEEELKDSSQFLAQLKDELQTTTKSYEGQLSMMSEHLASMNEKLAEQKDEIDELKAQKVPQPKEKKKFRK
ncbi:protein phosphatase 1 regulatory subunit 21-like isoform X2 [Mizuhopecten yessoensis]|uniref:Protein phosphatase 1 regulatory subunit 21 n=1 Tax=Mizuhopecten yessoensis TaxID=6573 RepID=A0A210QNU1_MIZYE|nr:protein phosphatase 1 regulatory subunit 21-like isoform X2 [Mizuhopecten yessoensis]OWF50404.1 Protein phosphatase 1 regulatory subunit 21 [Mizuhopecten yessoensis]